MPEEQRPVAPAPAQSRLQQALPFLGTAVGIFVLDQVTKVLVRARIEPGDSIDVAPFLELRHVHNTGIAFGLFAGSGVFVLIGTVIVAMVLFASLARIDDATPVTSAGIGLIAGGAIGNLLDRARLGHVTDMLHLPNWPTFNVADIAIVLGVTVVLIAQLRQERASHARTAHADGANGMGGDDAL